MEKVIKGKVYILGDNIDTDQITPAEPLVYGMSDPGESKKYGHFAMSGTPIQQAGLPDGGIPFIDGEKNTSEFSLILGGANFGCGSSREHAPYALQKAGVKAVIAESYARIFYRNSVDGGFIVPLESSAKINTEMKTGDNVELDLGKHILKNNNSGKIYDLRHPGDVLPIIEAGGLFEYARKSGMI